MRDNKKYTFNEKQKSSLNNSINHLKKAKKEAKRNKKTYNKLLNKAINELNQVKNENKDNKNKEEIDNELDNVKKDIENIMDNKEELLKLKNKLEGLKNDEKNNKGKIDVLLNKVNGKLKKLDKDKDKKEYKPKEKDDKHDKPDKKDDKPDKPDKKKDKPDKKEQNKNKNIIERYRKMIEKKERRNKNFDKYCVTNQHYRAPYLVKISPKHAHHLIGEAPEFSGLFTEDFSISQTIWESIKNKVNETMPGLFNNEGKAMVINDKGEINDKFFLYCVWNGFEDNYPWTNLQYLDPDVPGFQTIPGYKPMKKWAEKGQVSCYINFI